MTFVEAMDGLMATLVDAGFSNVATTANLADESGSVSFFGDEAERLLGLIQAGLDHSWCD